MFLSLIRKETDEVCTHGDLYVNGVWFCYTLEDPVRPYPDKVMKKTAIWGDRTYNVSVDHSPKFGRDMIHILEVPLFVGIRMHSGKNAEWTEGCPLLGKNRYGHSISHDPDIEERLKGLIRIALDANEKVTITVANPILPMAPLPLNIEQKPI